MRGLAVGNLLAGLGFALAVAALLFVFLWPGHSVIDDIGAAGAVAWGVAPVVVALLGFLASFSRSRTGRYTAWAAAVVLLTFSLVFGWGLGLVYFPAAVALILAAARGKSAAAGTYPA